MKRKEMKRKEEKEKKEKGGREHHFQKSLKPYLWQDSSKIRFILSGR